MPNQEEVSGSTQVSIEPDESNSEKQDTELVKAEAKHITGETTGVPVTFAPEESGNCASMDLAIQSQALSVSLRSRASLNPETIALTAQVRVLTDQLAQVAMKLDEANYKIGFLEAQMLAQREKSQELRQRLTEDQSPKKGVTAWLVEKLSFGRKPAS
jgi:hypothetical protein